MSFQEMNSKGVERLLILHDNHFSISGGQAEFRTTTFHLFLQGFNGRAHLTSPSLDWSGGVGEINIDGIVVRPRRGYGRAKDFYKSFFVNSFRAYVDIYRILKDYRAIVIAGPCCCAPYAHLAAWIQRKPVIGYVIGDNREVVKHSKEYVGVQKWFANLIACWEWAAMGRIARTHKVIALGPDLAKSLSKYSGNVSLGFTSLIRDEQIIVEKAFGSGSKLLLLSVGRASQEKGLEWVLRAIAILKRQRIGVHYLVVGDGPDLPRLRALTNELEIADSVEFTGAKPYGELSAYYHAADIFVLASHTEGVAKVLLEAMAARLPIVATQVGGNPWVLGDGERGMLIPYGDERAIVASIIKYKDDAQFRRSRLDCATDFIRQNTMKASAKRIMDTIDEEKQKMVKV